MHAFATALGSTQAAAAGSIRARASAYTLLPPLLLPPPLLLLLRSLFNTTPSLAATIMK
jgi:hypothetical protein